MSTGHEESAPSVAAPLVGLLEGWRRRLARFRIREHIRRAESALRDAEHAGLTVTERERRERHLDRLADYREHGEFPRNRERSARLPVFVGDDGTPCAMAHLLGEYGREDLVTAVMAEEPTVRIEDLPEAHPVVEWVEANGLTREEAARIQPTYPSGVQFATTCGPVPCWVAGALASVVGLATAGAIEYVGYRLVDDAFPDNALKRRATLSYLTVLALFVAPLVALVVFALFP